MFILYESNLVTALAMKCRFSCKVEAKNLLYNAQCFSACSMLHRMFGSNCFIPNLLRTHDAALSDQHAPPCFEWRRDVSQTERESESDSQRAAPFAHLRPKVWGHRVCCWAVSAQET